ncbi:MAG: hypothetical protein ACJAR9_000708 [Celeribacter sp.]|jgi:hypothetical protein
MPHPTLPAVDELADLRRTLVDLHKRELELCDEILAGATEIGATRVEGDTRIAVIETRTTQFLDMSKLPSEILNDPSMFCATPQTHVLLWPKTGASMARSAMIAAGPEVEKDTTEPEMHTELVENELAENEIDAGIDTDISPTDTLLDATPPISDGIDAPEMTENLIAHTDDIKHTNDVPSETDAPNFEGPVFDHTGADAPLPAIDIAPLDTYKIADKAQETAPPADLRATRYVDLQPMGDLTEEDLGAALYPEDSDLPPTVDPEAVMAAEALQNAFDTHVAASETIQDEAPAPFVTRRIIGAPA